MLEKKVKVTPPAPTPPGLDFESEESRYAFLREHLGTLMDGINNQYGTDIMAELLKRLENTVDEFNRQLSGLLDQLQDGKMRNYLEGDVAAEEFMTSPGGDPADKMALAFETETALDDSAENEIIKRLEARSQGKKKR